MRRFVLLLALAVPSLAFAPAPLPKPDLSGKELKRLQGTWDLGEEIYEGRLEPRRHGIQVTIVRDRLTFVSAGEEWDSYTLTVDARSKLKTFGLKDHGRGIATVALYSLEGDTLTFCWTKGFGPNRPPDLSGTGPNAWRSVFKRRKR